MADYVNVLLVFIPLGIVAAQLQWSPGSVFALNFFAIIPLAAILSFVTEELAEHLGETLGGLLNATFGNAVELIVSIAALNSGQIEVIQASLLGSIISNLLLVMGLCFLLGGIYNMTDDGNKGSEQNFASTTGQLTSTLMTLASASMVLPAALYYALEGESEDDILAKVLLLSRGTAIILLCLYVLYMIFQLRTHKDLFVSNESDAITAEVDGSGATMSARAAFIVLITTTILVSFCAEALVSSIDGLVESSNLSKRFIGLILIPIVSNAAEHATACVVAIKNKMDLALSVVIGASVQIALLVTPVLVLLGWCVGQPMSLHFQTFEIIVFALCVLVISHAIQDGRANYLEGSMMLGLYALIALAAWLMPSD
ncbi:calcium/proton exchanger [Plectosphaerella plurivora]|uniref:Vacuolar calcium ion transporter n=1 Tax=Plectosphaerella plurivora TaxID=936078 RepID=A0A9P8VGW7_9PEZI|nr:calcium/proton exchanger [Plectosphaerella plurivora]